MEKTAVTLSDGKIIEINCPTVKTVKIAMKKKGDEVEKSISMISACCNMTEEEVEELYLPDFITLQEALAPFLGKAGK